jgi:molecular chaperone GrpE
MCDKSKIDKYAKMEKVGAEKKRAEGGKEAREKEPDAPTKRREGKEAAKVEDPLKELTAKLESAEKEAKETYDRLLRVSAEFENYKKRTSREMDEYRKFANESVFKEMLPVVDNLERAIHSSNSANNVNSRIVEGVDMTLKEILKIFGKFGVTPVESLDKEFDPSFHQAVAQENSDDHPDNTVIKELQKGYTMHERLLRPAMVIVSKAGDPGARDED